MPRVGDIVKVPPNIVREAAGSGHSPLEYYRNLLSQQKQQAMQEKESGHPRTLTFEARQETRTQPQASMEDKSQASAQTIYQKQEGTFTASDGTQVPIINTYVKDNQGNVRLATETEKRQYFPSSYNKILKPGIATTSAIAASKVKGGYTTLNQDVREVITEPVFKLLEKAGVDEKSVTKAASISSVFSLVGIGPIGIGGKEISQFSGGVVSGLYKDIRAEPLKNAVLYGAGVGIGAGVSAAVKGAGVAGDLIAPSFKSAEFTKDLFSVTGTGLTAAYGVGLAKDISTSPDIKTAGGKLGVSLKDLGLIGAGAVRGQKVYQQVSGYIATRGRVEVPLEKLTPAAVVSGEENFPYAHGKNQLNLFLKSEFGKAINEPAGAFHTTPEKFWKDIITPREGTSELPGLYGSHAISTHFAKVSGTSSDVGFKLFDTSIAATEPGVAYLEPLKFREAGYKEVKPYKVVEQYFKYKFTTPAEIGSADIPNMKPEVEAIFRTDAGSYEFKSGNYFTKIKGVRTPIDVFKFADKTTKDELSFAKKSVKESYSYPGKYSLTSPETLALSSVLSRAGRSSFSSAVSKLSRGMSSYVSAPSSRAGYAFSSDPPSIVSAAASDPISSPLSRGSSSISNMARYEPYSTGGTSGGGYYPTSRKKYKAFPKLNYDLNRKLEKELKGFDLGIVSKGRHPRIIATGLSLRSARSLGAKRVLSDLAATFFLRKSNKPARDLDIPDYFKKYERKFRKPTRKSPYRKLGFDVEIQKQSGLGGRLFSRGEKLEIASYSKRRKRRKIRIGID